jgi:sugar lactone lactonase YvrE
VRLDLGSTVPESEVELSRGAAERHVRVHRLALLGDHPLGNPYGPGPVDIDRPDHDRERSGRLESRPAAWDESADELIDAVHCEVYCQVDLWGGWRPPEYGGLRVDRMDRRLVCLTTGPESTRCGGILEEHQSLDIVTCRTQRFDYLIQPTAVIAEEIPFAGKDLAIVGEITATAQIRGCPTMHHRLMGDELGHAPTGTGWDRGPESGLLRMGPKPGARTCDRLDVLVQTERRRHRCIVAVVADSDRYPQQMVKPRLHPRRWTPPAAVTQTATDSPLVVVPLSGTGTEDVLVDLDGSVLTGLADGRIVRVRVNERTITQVANTGGRPLGLEFDPGHMLVVCDAHRGLLRVDPASGSTDVLLTDVNGTRMKFCNNAAVAADGTIYFTDSSTRFGIEHWKGDLLEHSATGRLLRRSPEGVVTTLLERLAFANGVALAPDESYLVVAETGAYRLRRLWLTGTRPGADEPFVPVLPGFPDNVSTGSDGLIWTTVASPRNRLLDYLLPRAPRIRSVAWRFPERLLPKVKRSVRVQAYDAAGRLMHDLAGPATNFHLVTGVREHHGRVWLGSLVDSAIAYFDLT